MAELAPLRAAQTPKRYRRLLRTERVPVRLTYLEKSRLARLAQMEGVPLSELIRRATLPLIDGAHGGRS